MADTTLAQVEELAQSLPPEEQRLLAQNLLQSLGAEDPVYSPKPKRSKEEIQKDLDRAWGAWGNKTADEIDKEINEMRERDWSRDWPKEL